MFACVCLAICAVVGLWVWKGRGLLALPTVLNRNRGPRGATAMAGCDQRREAELKRAARLRALAAIADTDTSLMEVRMTGSLKCIRDQAELGLVASDADKARHLAAIWTMAACDLDDDRDYIAH
jgi:hypothetical protein